MGLLDELREKAKAVEATKVDATAGADSARAKTEARLQRRLQVMYKYFAEFKRHLEVVSPEVVVSYDIRGLGEVGGLQQGNYGLATERPERVERFTFRCDCVKEGRSEVRIADTASANDFRNYLRDHGLRFKARDGARGGASFLVDLCVPVVLDFKPDVDRAAIVLHTRNMQRMGPVRYTLTIDKISETLMDELAKLLLRKPNRFDEMMGNCLTETGKFRIRSGLAAREDAGCEPKQREAGEPRAKRFGFGLLGRKSG